MSLAACTEDHRTISPPYLLGESPNGDLVEAAILGSHGLGQLVRAQVLEPASQLRGEPVAARIGQVDLGTAGQNASVEPGLEAAGHGLVVEQVADEHEVEALGQRLVQEVRRARADVHVVEPSVQVRRHAGHCEAVVLLVNASDNNWIGIRVLGGWYQYLCVSFELPVALAIIKIFGFQVWPIIFPLFENVCTYYLRGQK